MQCELAICRTYRFKAGESREEFDGVIQVSFDQILNLGNRLVSENSLQAGEMLRMIMKSFKHAIYFDLPTHLASNQQMVNWCTLMTRIIAKDVPAEGLPEDSDEREKNHWWKAKKWAYSNLNRLYMRYGNPSTPPKNQTAQAADFSKNFVGQFAPGILETYLTQIGRWVAKETWLSRPALTASLTFLDECIKPKSMWALLKPHVANLIEHVVFPILCQSDEDLEMFENEPEEYVHRKLNYYEEVTAPDVVAQGFLLNLTKCRKKQTFEILNFVNNVVSKYENAPEAEKKPKEKEGALRTIGSLAEVLLAKNSPIASQVEYFFVRYVFPEFRSPHGFLRARACNSVQKFDRLDFREESNLLLVYRNVLESFLQDKALPVKIEAALALQLLIRHEVIKTEMQAAIPHVMQGLLNLANEVDVDSLANVMEDFVEAFSTELTPFAVALSEQLRDTYLRLVRELIEKQSGKDDDDGYGDFLDDKSITALGVLQTIGTLILTLESTPDVLLHLETILMPVITITLDNKLFDLYNEVFEIVDSCTFSAKSISPTMWEAFNVMYKAFKSGAQLYLEDMLPALDNFLMYGSETMFRNPQYIAAVVTMISDIFRDNKGSAEDRISGCRLAEAAMLSLRGHLDEYLATLIELPMTVILTEDLKVKTFRIHLLEMIINAVYYNPLLAVRILEGKGWTNRFFSAWFSHIEHFNRVHDKKLSILAISSLMTLRADDVPTSVQQGWPRLMQGIVRLFQTLPAAEKQREEATKDNEFAYYDDDDDEEEETWADESQWNNDDNEPEADVKDENAAYLEFLQEEVRNSSLGQNHADMSRGQQI